MTIAEPATSSPTGPSSARSGDQRLILVLVTCALGVAVMVTAWWAWTSYAVGKVEVSVAEAPTCTGTDLRPDGRTIQAKPGMSCVYTVTVENNGPVELHLDRSVLTVLGNGGGPVAMAAAVDGREPAEAAGEVDAQIELDHDLDSGDSWSFRLRVVFRPDGCGEGRLWVDDWPIVQVSYLGREVQAQGSDQFAVHTKRQNPGCDM